VDKSGQLIEFTNRYGNQIAISLIGVFTAAALLGIGTTQLLDLDAWLRAAGELLRKL